jgi:hypothetical protein
MDLRLHAGPLNDGQGYRSGRFAPDGCDFHSPTDWEKWIAAGSAEHRIC